MFWLRTLLVYGAKVCRFLPFITPEHLYFQGLVLPKKEFARRWRACNPSHPGLFTDEGKEEEWRSRMLRILTDAHNLGGFEELSFEVVPSRNAVRIYHSCGRDLRRLIALATGPRV